MKYSDQFDLKEFITIILYEWKLILVVIIFSFSACIIYTKNKGVEWEVKSEITPVSNQDNKNLADLFIKLKVIFNDSNNMEKFISNEFLESEFIRVFESNKTKLKFIEEKKESTIEKSDGNGKIKLESDFSLIKAGSNLWVLYHSSDKLTAIKILTSYTQYVDKLSAKQIREKIISKISSEIIYLKAKLNLMDIVNNSIRNNLIIKLNKCSDLNLINSIKDIVVLPSYLNINRFSQDKRDDNYSLEEYFIIKAKIGILEDSINKVNDINVINNNNVYLSSMKSNNKLSLFIVFILTGLMLSLVIIFVRKLNVK